MRIEEERAIMKIMERTPFGFDEIVDVYNKVLTLKTVERVLEISLQRNINPMILIDILHGERNISNALGNEIFAR